MASSTISALRPQHRGARLDYGQTMPDGLALDWLSGQAIALSGASQQSSAFDANRDVVVMVSVGGASTVVGCWISVGTNPTASAGAGSMWISQQSKPQPVYVAAGQLIAGIQGATGGTLSMVPALTASNA